MSHNFENKEPSQVASLPAYSEASVDTTDFDAEKYPTAPASINGPSVYVTAELPQQVQIEPAQPAGGKSRSQIYD
jgi:hypothetical protein